GTGAPAPTSPTPMAATPSIVPNVPLPPTRMAAAPPATAAPAPVAAAPAAATAAAGGFFVQVASARSEADAQTAWRAAQSKYPGVLNGQTVAFRRADLGDRGIYYRAQVGPFGSREDANGLCQSLRAQGGDCMVQRN
ncbi:MAG TPA: SPOR domain-containing protein, partial [Ancylobacter sp.]